MKKFAGLICAMCVSMFSNDALAQDKTKKVDKPAQIQVTVPPGIDQKVLQKMVDRAEKSESDALIIYKGDKLVGEWYFGKKQGPIEAMSVTKSIVALAFGRLLFDGRIKTLDEPVYKYFPEWNQGRKSKITVRHLLMNRSGLQSFPTTEEIYRQRDFVQLALAAELTEDPGVQFRYNNKAINLLPAIVKKIAGKTIDVFLGEELFQPMGITDFSWSKDRVGNPHGMSGLQIRPLDLAKLGRLMLNNGKWEGKQLLSESFVQEASSNLNALPAYDPNKELKRYTPGYGLLWWTIDSHDVAITDRLLNSWRKDGVPDDFISKMATIKNLRGTELRTAAAKLAGGADKWDDMTWKKNRVDFDILSTKNLGYAADGYLGQYIVVVPKHKIVTVRMRRSPMFGLSKGDGMTDFRALSLGLVKD